VNDKFYTFIVLILSCLISVLVVECLLRFFFPQPLYNFGKGLFAASPEYGYALTPHVAKTHRQPDYTYTIRSNSEGFRGREPNYLADTRILILGDSYGMGQGVAEGKSMCDLTHQHFKASGKSFDIFNTSVPGYAGINELGVLKRQLKNYKPTLVILLFFWNDLGITESLCVQNGYLVLNFGNRQTAPLREWLNNNSHFYALLKRSWYAFKSPQAKTSNSVIPQTDIDVALNYIFRMKQLCDQHNTVFVTILLPVDGVYAGSPAIQSCRKMMIKELNNNAVPYRDWTLILPQEGREQYIFRHDQHWNDLGNAYFSHYLIQVIDDFLKERQG
jgi:hypothetical protein